ncbi:diguanylate cyclase [Acetonema longum DSM 6540]|uniref:Diguanylate cyclase n=2 Tax=Acetonema TaxID=2373 RepID=F7NDM5_9FIRM|nr:diguanylate cyclase [Acetonema longum DSM 6540]
MPFALLALAYAGLWAGTGSESLAALAKSLSCLIILAGMILSWWFNRSRAFFVLVVLGLSQFLLMHSSLVGDQAFFRSTVVPVVCFLIPLNLYVFSRIQERGIFNAWGLKRMWFIGMQGVFVLAVILSRDAGLVSLITSPLAPAYAFTSLPPAAIFAYVLTFILLIRHSYGDFHLNSAMLGVLTASAVAFHFQANALSVPLFFAAAGLMLAVAMIQDSYSMAYFDELTGLPARRALKEEMLRLSGRYTIAMLDIDYFKKFNDTYGHTTGDAVLQLVASVIKETGGDAKPFRYGGEEFVIVFPDKRLQQALPYLEELREKVGTTAYISKDAGKHQKRSPRKLFVTVSIGAAEATGRLKTAEAVVKAADKALYRAKEQGRNCVSK